ncbi:S1 family peptidase [Streptomyces anthocyanicus]|uniref:S1 family peptidase n=1 Tax=Streptomyces anthocyanicus TaxID=68174 RepID=UPI00381507CD
MRRAHKTGALLGAALFALAVLTPVGSAVPAGSAAGRADGAAVTGPEDSVDSAESAPPVRAAAQQAAADFTGTVDVAGCSGAVVRMPGSAAGDQALVMTNAHCYEGAWPVPGEVLVDQPSHRLFNVLGRSGETAVQVHATKALYVTLTGTDLALYQVPVTYRELERDHKVTALTLATRRPARDTDIHIVSAGLKKQFTCKVDHIAYRVLEFGNITKDVLRYTSGCDTDSGTSGSPVLSDGRVVAINNTSNHDGGRCTLDNPCEMARNGTITTHKGIGYATQTYWLTTCMAPGTHLDLKRPGCLLPRSDPSLARRGSGL